MDITSSIQVCRIKDCLDHIDVMSNHDTSVKIAIVMTQVCRIQKHSKIIKAPFFSPENATLFVN